MYSSQSAFRSLKLGMPRYCWLGACDGMGGKSHVYWCGNKANGEDCYIGWSMVPIPAGVTGLALATIILLQVQIIRHARTHSVGTSQSCMFSEEQRHLPTGFKMGPVLWVPLWRWRVLLPGERILKSRTPFCTLASRSLLSDFSQAIPLKPTIDVRNRISHRECTSG